MSEKDKEPKDGSGKGAGGCMQTGIGLLSLLALALLIVEVVR